MLLALNRAALGNIVGLVAEPPVAPWLLLPCHGSPGTSQPVWTPSARPHAATRPTPGPPPPWPSLAAGI